MSSRPVRTTLRCLALAAAALSTWQAHAVQVSATVSGLPPGLSAVLTVKRNVCPDGMGWIDNPSVPLTETSFTTIEQVTGFGGMVSFRTKVVTRYVASFDTPASTGSGVPAYEVRCSTVGIASDQFAFGLRIAGQDAADQPASATASLGTTSQTGPVTVARTMAAATSAFTPSLQVLSRGIAQTMDATFGTTIGTVQGQRIDFLRPNPLILGSFTKVASIFVRSSDNAACVQAGTTTQCLSGSTPVEAGGVRLVSLQRTVSGLPGTSRFRFELTGAFPIGTLKLRAAANASDLPSYLVDGAPQSIDLLPWQPLEQTVTVQ
ncbi:MAG: hypothetical protein U1F56_22125 [Rubrivivax sp.]